MEGPKGSKVTIVVVLGLLLLGAAIDLLFFYRRLHPVDLDAWVACVQRPGQQLLYKAEQSDHYFAVFDSAGGRISFCVRDLKPGKGVTASSTAILDEEGKDLEVNTEPLRETHRLFLIASYVELQGTMFFLRPGYQGSMRLIYREGHPRIGSGGKTISDSGEGPVLLDTVLRR
jgi:hypothetical protein